MPASLYGPTNPYDDLDPTSDIDDKSGDAPDPSLPIFEWEGGNGCSEDGEPLEMGIDPEFYRDEFGFIQRTDPGAEWGCCFPGECLMPGEHQKRECHTVEMMEEMAREHDQ